MLGLVFSVCVTQTLCHTAMITCSLNHSGFKGAHAHVCHMHTFHKPDMEAKISSLLLDCWSGRSTHDCHLQVEKEKFNMNLKSGLDYLVFHKILRIPKMLRRVFFTLMHHTVMHKGR